jgi:hypothetical protein
MVIAVHRYKITIFGINGAKGRAVHRRPREKKRDN